MSTETDQKCPHCGHGPEVEFTHQVLLKKTWPNPVYSTQRAYADGVPMLRVALDFDETIAKKWPGRFPGPAVFNAPPIDGAFGFIQELLFEGHQVIIHSVRLNEPKALYAMRSWFLEHGLPETTVERLMWWVQPGKPWADVYFDDRGYRFKGTYPTVAELEKLVTHI